MQKNIAADQLAHPDRLFIAGQWRQANGKAIPVVDSSDETVLFHVATASKNDVDAAISAAREAFDHCPWPRMSHQQRATFLRDLADGFRSRGGSLANIWTKQSGVLSSLAVPTIRHVAETFDYYAQQAEEFTFEEAAQPTAGGSFGLLVRGLCQLN